MTTKVLLTIENTGDINRNDEWTCLLDDNELDKLPPTQELIETRLVKGEHTLPDKKSVSIKPIFGCTEVINEDDNIVRLLDDDEFNELPPTQELIKTRLVKKERTLSDLCQGNVIVYILK